MRDNVKALTFLVIVLSAAWTGAACSGPSNSPSATTLQRDLAVSLPLGTPKETIMDYLSSHRIEHHVGLSTECPYCPKREHGVDEPRIDAIVRGKPDIFGFSNSVVLFFYCDKSGKLERIAAKNLGTGP